MPSNAVLDSSTGTYADPIHPVSSATPYLGVIATRCKMPIQAPGASLQAIQSRTHHRARDAVSAVSVGWGNWRVAINGVGDTAAAGTSTIKASIEYPAGTIVQLTFGGSSTGTMTAGQTLISDPAAITIPRGAKFFVRSLITNASGILFLQENGGVEPNGPDTCEYNASVSGLTDKTLSGTITGSNDTWWPPLVILGQTQRPSFMLVGDSIGAGVQETWDDGASDVGVLARSIGPWFGYSNLCVSGDNLAAYATTSASRRALLPYFSHVISQLGTNDFAAGAATVLTRLASHGALFAGKQRFICTLTPKSTSTDAWATTTNQTGDTVNIAVNKGIRAGILNWEGMIDLCSAVEAVPDSSKWNTALGTITSDGLHPLNLGTQMIRRSGVINPGLFYR